MVCGGIPLGRPKEKRLATKNKVLTVDKISVERYFDAIIIMQYVAVCLLPRLDIIKRLLLKCYKIPSSSSYFFFFIPLLLLFITKNLINLLYYILLYNERRKKNVTNECGGPFQAFFSRATAKIRSQGQFRIGLNISYGRRGRCYRC